MGGWLVKQLLAEEAEVVALVRDRVPRTMFASDGLSEQVTVVEGRLEDLALLRRTLAEYPIKTVFHLAAQPLVGVAVANPVGTLEANVMGTWNVLEAARQTGVAETIVASSDKAYGASSNLPYFESHPLRGTFPYDVSKSCADLISTMYAQTYGLPVAVMRCANLFGGGDLNFNRTFPGIIKSTLLGQQFRVRSDGTCVRDFLYVKDAARAYMMVAEGLARQPELAGEAFNFSMGVKLTVIECAEMVLCLMHREDLRPIIENRARAEIQEQYMTYTKARGVFGWEPQYGMEQALLETIDWYAAHFGIVTAKPAAWKHAS
jgi:CDP-glucose 4,6-dehydratase